MDRRYGLSVLNSRRWFLVAILVATGSLVVLGLAIWPRPHHIVCDFYTYNVTGGTRDTMTPPPGWIETSPGSDCWWTP